MTAESGPGQFRIYPAYISDILRNPPKDWERPRVRVLTALFEQSGILPQMARRNPEFQDRVTDFFIGKKNILIVGGESGMGKSLVSADLRSLHGELQVILPPELRSGLAVISWDRSHKAFFEEVSTEIGETIPLPQGETHLEGRGMVSKLLGDQIRFIKKYLGRDTRILLEAPLINMRGETVFQELEGYRNEAQIFIMCSPKSRYETIRDGRLMETSGQRDSMESIREKLLYRITGMPSAHRSPEEQDEIIKNWWSKQVEEWGGMVVEWDPDDNRVGLKNSQQRFVQLGIKPDVLAPRALSRFTRNQLQSIFLTIPDMDRFLQTVTS